MKYQCLPILLGLACAGQVFGAKIIPINAAANLVLGQPDFVTGSFLGPFSPFNMGTPNAVVIDPVTGKVFVADEDGDRVLRYPNFSSLVNQSGAEAVFGQPNFSKDDSVTTQQGMSNPAGLFLDRFGRLWVADRSNNRVLMFEAASFRGENPFADRVFGQADFVTSTSSAAANKMAGPNSVWVDTSDNLWVADTNNHRVLRFNAVSSKFSGSPADGVLGQVNFTTGTAGSGSSGFQFPGAIAVSSTGELFVSCGSGNRILRFSNAATLGNGAGASAVLGQSDFSATTSGTTANSLSSPAGLALTPTGDLWVCDSANNRVLRYTSVAAKANGAAADGVVGQTNFTTGAFATTATGLDSPRGQPFVDSAANLWVPDTFANRVLRFPPDETKPVLVVTSTVPKTVSKKSLLIKGTASDAFGISKVQFKVNSGAVQTATGTTSWQFTAALKSGKNTVTINAIDSVGNLSTSKVFKIKRGSSGVAPLLLTLED